MRFDLHFRSAVLEQIENLAETMKSLEDQPRLTESEKKLVSQRLASYKHTTTKENLRCASVGSGGDFPSVCYGDFVIYATAARVTVYESDVVSGLKEIGPTPEPTFYFTLIPEDEDARHESLDNAFALLAGASLTEVIEASDYRQLKAMHSRRPSSVDALCRNLIRPHAADAGNLGIQLRSTSEMGALLHLLRGNANLNYILVDGTLSLPLVSKADVSLFYEHLKRLCCVEALKQGIGLFTLSKNHGIGPMEWIEELAREKAGTARGDSAEHWYLRLPIPGVDSWETTLNHARRLPPAGAVTYLIRFHRGTSTMRLDMDREFWFNHVQGTTEERTSANERHIFEDLDYLTHDQRSYGYPYPIRSARDRAILTKVERTALRKQIIAAAVRAGMKRSLFREVISTGID
jgi:hypothetical protein